MAKTANNMLVSWFSMGTWLGSCERACLNSKYASLMANKADKITISLTRTEINRHIEALEDAEHVLEAEGTGPELRPLINMFERAAGGAPVTMLDALVERGTKGFHPFGYIVEVMKRHNAEHPSPESAEAASVAMDILELLKVP